MFDTYRAVTALRQAGFQDEQAVALVSTIGDALTGDLATKSDIADVRKEISDVRKEVADVRAEVADVRAEVAEVRKEVADLRTEIANVRVDLYRQLWVMGIAIVTLNVTLTVALIKLLP